MWEKEYSRQREHHLQRAYCSFHQCGQGRLAIVKNTIIID